MMRRLPAILISLTILTGCGPTEVNAPTEPAQSVDSGPAAAAETGAGVNRGRPGTGPTSFVGRWAADAAWCPNTSGERQPIRITPLQFEGYENTCTIDRVDEAADSYLVDMTCTAEGMTSQERVRMTVDGQSLELTWLKQGDARVRLTKCTTLADTSVAEPVS